MLWLYFNIHFVTPSFALSPFLFKYGDRQSLICPHNSNDYQGMRKCARTRLLLNSLVKNSRRMSFIYVCRQNNPASRSLLLSSWLLRRWIYLAIHLSIIPLDIKLPPSNASNNRHWVLVVAPVHTMWCSKRPKRAANQLIFLNSKCSWWIWWHACHSSPPIWRTIGPHLHPQYLFF